MFSLRFYLYTAGLCTSLLLAGCLGNDNTSSSNTLLSPSLSANQQAFENFYLAPSGQGAYSLQLNLASSGTQVSGTNYIQDAKFQLTASPSISAQEYMATAQSLTASLLRHANTPQKLLVNGAIVSAPNDMYDSSISYSNGNIVLNDLSAPNITNNNNKTIIASQTISNVSFVPLSGLISATTTDFTNAFAKLFANPALLVAGTSYQTGAGYLKWTSTNMNDRYVALDCTAQQTSTDANIVACAQGTLTGQLTAGILDPEDGQTTYTLADGAINTVNGVQVWIANTPLANPRTQAYRIFFQLNNVVYMGYLVKDGTVFGGGQYVVSPSSGSQAAVIGYTDYQVVLNKPAIDSIQGALAF